MRTNGGIRKPSAAAAFALLAALVPGIQPVARAAASESPRGGPREGIKVHGRWTIDVKNADGSLVARHEFENALDSDGGVVLAKCSPVRRSLASGEWP